ncbi:MAG: hypothetical protein SFZ24_02400 [Planctomycetota bacterium]|nr:hypothetical protein [Planctomycetota bacterium]
MIWVWLGLAAAAALVAGAWISRLAWQDERSRTPEYRAFRRLAWELRLGPLTRRTLDKLAAGARLPPVALLLSRSALDRAARLGGLSSSEHERLAKRLFGNR